tara:strand:- start:382 stop:537 length:156 start_codon:yes stop_codon:yes gene_type:complete
MRRIAANTGDKVWLRKFDARRWERKKCSYKWAKQHSMLFGMVELKPNNFKI